MGQLIVRGTAGYLDGEVATVPRGEEIVVGRSRSCGMSLRLTRRWKETGRSESEAETEFRAISRRHARIRVLSEGEVEVTGLGKNGTFVDGVKVDQVVLRDLRERPHEIRLGPRETARLEWGETSDDGTSC